MALPDLSIGRPVATAMAAAAAVLLGIVAFTRLPVDLLPDVAFPTLTVWTEYPEAGPEEVERFVTAPIEAAVARTPGVRSLSSVSREGVSIVRLRFLWGTDMDFATLNARERLDNVRALLPERASRPAILRADPTSEPVMTLAVASDSVGLPELKRMAEDVFRRRLEQIDGIAQAALAGGLEREIHVEIEPRRLEALGVTIESVASALEAANWSAPGGTIRRGRYRYALRALGEFQSVDEIATTVVDHRPDGSRVMLSDIARVQDAFADRETIARYGGRESVGMLLYKESGANTVRAAERVEAVLDQLRAEYPGVEIAVAGSQAGFIRDAISNVVQALVLGGALAFLVLFVFLRDARYPIAISLSIPISVMLTFGLLYLFDVSLNIMSLGGLALGVGMLVDNSIVVLENVFRHRERGRPAREAAALGAREVQGAITASTLTTIAVFAPIVYVKGVAGELFEDLSIAVAASLLISLLVALTLLPMMAARIGSRAAVRSTPDVFDRAFNALARRYHTLLEWSLDHRAATFGVAGATFAAALLLGLGLPRDLLPPVDEGAYRARIELPPGTPLETTDAAAARVEARALADPATDAVFVRVGRAREVEATEEATGRNTAAVDVRLLDGARTAAAIARLRAAVVGALPDEAISIETGRATALGRVLGLGEADVAVRIRGDDLEAALALAAEVERRIAPIAGVADVRTGLRRGQPEIEIAIDRDRVARHGLTVRQVADAIEAYMRGLVPTRFVDFDRRIDVLVRPPEEVRRRFESLLEFGIGEVPVRQLIAWRERLAPIEIRREAQSRVVPVYADVTAGGLAAAVEASEGALAGLEPPPGLRYEVGGVNEEMRDSFRSLALAFALALALVFMILAAQFESLVHPLTILLAVPLAAIGAIGALAIAGDGVNVMSLIGFVILIGIVVNDAIIKVDFINQYRREGAELREAILEAGRVRLRPILMTTVTTVLGLTPLALGLGAGADLRAPLAVAVIGGLLSATLLTLVVVPVLYATFEGLRVRVRAGAGADRAAIGSAG